MCFTDPIVYVLMFTYYSVSIVTTQAPCQAGWFGSRCQFQCHCAQTCDVTTGQCLRGSKCQLGWFGVACQYQDLACVNSAAITANVDLSSPNWITDRDDSTCSGDVNLESVVVTWNDTTPFTWLRFAVNFISGLENLTVTFKTSAKEMIEIPCNNKQIFLVDNHTMDVRCNVTVDVMQVIIRGHSVKSLCSLYISGGRNVALKQSASQTSNYTTETSFNIQASNAVDGNTCGIIYDNTCSHTATDDPSPSWNVKFDRPQAVNRFVLYNRVDDNCGVGLPCSDRLKHFILQSVDSNNNTILNYQDATAMALSVYTLKVPGHLRDLPVSGVHITATVIVIIYKKPTLTICEFEAYGECVPGTWGLECNNQCNSSCNTTCHAETGACPVCIGISSPQCDAPCKPGTWGLGCAQECSSSCLGKFCDPITGVCDNGCNNDSGLSTCTPDEPTVLRFTANGNTSIEVDHTTPVTLHCEVQSDVVPARALITAGRGLGKVQEWVSNNETITMTLPSLTCEDSGRFFCSGLNGFEKNDTTRWKYVDINIVCALKPKDPSVLNVVNTIQVSPQNNTVFTLEVYGYPVPTNFGLKIETGRGKEDVDKGRYDITYIPLTPPVGLVKVTIYDAETRGTTTYYVSVKNDVGEAVELRLDVVKEDPVLTKSDGSRRYAETPGSETQRRRRRFQPTNMITRGSTTRSKTNLSNSPTHILTNRHLIL